MSVGQPPVKTPWGIMNVNVQKATHTIKLPRTVKVGLPCPSLSPSLSFISLCLLFFNPLLYQIPVSHIVVYLLIFTLFITIWLNCLFSQRFSQPILRVAYTVAMTYCQSLEGFTIYSCVLLYVGSLSQFIGAFLSHCREDFLCKLSSQLTYFFQISWNNMLRIWMLLECHVPCF